MSYDSWLEAPYTREPSPECPECGAQMDEDKFERTVDCPECGYADGFDWDAEAERRREYAEDNR